MSDQNFLEVGWVICSDNPPYFSRLSRRVASFETPLNACTLYQSTLSKHLDVFSYHIICFMFMNGLTARNLVVPPRAQTPLEATGNPRMGTLLNEQRRSLLYLIRYKSPYFYDGATPMSGKTRLCLSPSQHMLRDETKR